MGVWVKYVHMVPAALYDTLFSDCAPTCKIEMGKPFSVAGMEKVLAS